jgi:hypothetical protein
MEEEKYILTECCVCGHDMNDPQIQDRNYIDFEGKQFCGWECVKIGSKEYEGE